MFSILKKNWVDLFCYTDNKTICDYFPIASARQFIPDWWKEIPNDLVHPGHENEIKSLSNKANTMKRCPGIIEYYKKGFMLPLWCDLEFIVDKGDVSISIAHLIGEKGYESHLSVQKGRFLSEDVWKHVKLVSPWQFESSEKIDFLYLQPHWNLNNLNKNILIPNGLIDFFFQYATEIQMFVNREYDGVVSITAGTPMIHFVPLTDKKIKLHVLHDRKKHADLDDISKISFVSDYYRKVKEYKKGT